MGPEGNVRLGAATHLGPYLSLPRSSPSRIRSGRGAHPAAWATGPPGPRFWRSVPYTCAASFFSAETGGSLSTPSPDLTSPKDAQEWRGVEASFPSPSTWAGGPAQSPPTWGRIRGGRARVSGEEGGGGSTWPRVARNREELKGKWEDKSWMLLFLQIPPCWRS